MAWSQDTIALRRAAERDDVADFHVRRIDQDPVDAQFHQLAAQRNRRTLRSLRDRRPKLLGPHGQLLQLLLLHGRCRQRLLLPRQPRQPVVQPCAPRA